jgi:hypothetical protein
VDYLDIGASGFNIKSFLVLSEVPASIPLPDTVVCEVSFVIVFKIIAPHFTIKRN